MSRVHGFLGECCIHILIGKAICHRWLRVSCIRSAFSIFENSPPPQSRPCLRRIQLFLSDLITCQVILIVGRTCYCWVFRTDTYLHKFAEFYAYTYNIGLEISERKTILHTQQKSNKIIDIIGKAFSVALVCNLKALCHNMSRDCVCNQIQNTETCGLTSY